MKYLILLCLVLIGCTQNKPIVSDYITKECTGTKHMGDVCKYTTNAGESTCVAWDLTHFAFMVTCRFYDTITTPKPEPYHGISYSKFKVGDCGLMYDVSEIVDGKTGKVKSKPIAYVSDLKLKIVEIIGNEYIFQFYKYDKNELENPKYSRTIEYLDQQYALASCDGKYEE